MKYYIELYQQKSVSKAADNLFISRQALSVMLHKMEEEFQTKLFVRTNNGIVATEAGEQLYHDAVKIVNQYSILNYNMKKYAHFSLKPTISIGIGDTLANFYGDDIIELLNKAFPSINFKISIFANINPYALEYENYDIVIASVPDIKAFSFTDAEVYKLQILQKRNTAIRVSPKSPLCDYKSITYHTLKDYTQIIYKDSIDPSIVVPINNKIETVTLKHQLLELLESPEYYMIDLPFLYGDYPLSQFFQGKNIVQKETNIDAYIVVVFDKKLCSDYIPIISTAFYQKLEKSKPTGGRNH